MRKILLAIAIFCSLLARAQDANKNALNTAIDDSVRTNGLNKITAATLNAILHRITNGLIDSTQALNTINAQKGLTNGIAGLSSGKVPFSQLPPTLDTAYRTDDTTLTFAIHGNFYNIILRGKSGSGTDTTSLSARINAKLTASDTTAMLTAYLRFSQGVKYIDTANMLVPYLRFSQGVKYIDTSGLLANYIRSALAVKYTDTAGLLAGYVRTSNFTPAGIGLGNLLNSRQVVNIGGLDSMAAYAHLAGFPAASVGPTLAYAVDSNAIYYNNRLSYTKIVGGVGGGGGSADSSVFVTRTFGTGHYYPLSGNPSAFLTAITGSMITTALGFAPYSASNPNSYISANQTISFAPSGGDVAGTATGGTSLAPTLVINANAVSYAKMQQNAAKSIIGNPGTSAANNKALFPKFGLVFDADSIKTDTAAIVSKAFLAAQSFLTSEVALAKIVTLNQGLGVHIVGTAGQTVGANPTYTFTADTSFVSTLTAAQAKVDLLAAKVVGRVSAAPDSLSRTAAGFQVVGNTLVGQSANGSMPGFMTPALFLELDSLYRGLIKSKIQIVHPGAGVWNGYTSPLGDSLYLKNWQVGSGFLLATQTDSSNKISPDFTVLVGVSNTQTIPNKTFTAPVINVGFDATADMYYRNSSGLYTRLPIGNEGQAMRVVSGLPAWKDTTAGGAGSQNLSQVLTAIADTLKISGGSSALIAAATHSAAGLVTAALQTRLDSTITVANTGHGRPVFRAPWTMDSLIARGIGMTGTGPMRSTYTGTNDSISFNFDIIPGTNGWTLTTVAGVVQWYKDSTYMDFARDWAAVNDGVTDNSAVFNTAVNYCVANNRKLHIGKGPFLMSGTSDIALVNGKTGSLTITGDGGKISELLMPSKTGALLDIINSNIDGLTITGLYNHSSHDTTATGNNAILLQGFNPTRIRNVHISHNIFEGFTQSLTLKGVIGGEITFNSFRSPLGHDNGTTTSVPNTDNLFKDDSTGDQNKNIIFAYNDGDGWSGTGVTRLSTARDNFIYGHLGGTSYVGHNTARNYGQETFALQVNPNITDSGALVVEANVIDAHLKVGSLVLNSSTKKTSNFGIRSDAVNASIINNTIYGATVGIEQIMSPYNLANFSTVIRNNHIYFATDTASSPTLGVYVQGNTAASRSKGLIMDGNDAWADGITLKAGLSAFSAVWNDSANITHNTFTARRVTKNGNTITGLNLSTDTSLYISGNTVLGADANLTSTAVVFSTQQTIMPGMIIKGAAALQDGTQCNGCTILGDASGNMHWGSLSGIGTVTKDSVGNLAPLFSSVTSNMTTTPVTTYTLSNACPQCLFANTSTSSAVPAYVSSSLTGPLFANQASANTVLHGNVAGNLSFSPVNFNTDVTGTMQAAQEPAHSGDVSNTAGSLNLVIGASKVTNAMLLGGIDLASKMTGILGGANGGTGANNGSSIFSIGGNVTYSGAFASVFNITAATNITLPTTGTVLTKTGDGSGLAGIVASVTGTPNEIIITPSGTSYTFSTPQPLAPGSSVTFTQETLTGMPAGAGTDDIVSELAGVLRHTPASAFITANVPNAFNGWQAVSSSGTVAITKSNVEFLNSSGITSTLQFPGSAVDGQTEDLDLGNAITNSPVTLTITTSASNGFVMTGQSPGVFSISLGTLNIGTHIHATFSAGAALWYVNKF